MSKAISDWLDAKTISEQEFFLKQKDHPDLYDKANELYLKSQTDTSSKKFPQPVEQLSPKGLALMSYLYAEKDKNESQPLIASSIEDFIHLIKLIDKSPAGTSLVIIFQPTDSRAKDTEGDYKYGSYIAEFPTAHKTVFKVERRDSDILLLNMDGTNKELYGSVGQIVAKSALKPHSKESIPKERKVTELIYAYQKNPKVPNPKDGEEIALTRQIDEYQCGVFAHKDARQLTRDEAIMTNAFSPESAVKFRNKTIPDLHHYDLPPEYFKGTQSSVYTDYADKLHGEKVVSRGGKTLKQVHEKHGPGGYVQHFAQKYHDQVTNFLDKNKEHPDVVREAVEKYDAGKMTLERLAKIYAPKQRRHKFR